MQTELNKVIAAVQEFYAQETFLLERDLGERTLTHRIAVYVERQFAGWQVDCNYDRLGERTLRLPRGSGSSTDDHLGKSIYLQPSFSAPVIFLGGLLFGYGMVLSNGCGSRALVLLGRGNLRSFVVVIVLGIVAEMTLKGLIAPARIAMVQASQATVSANSVPALLAGSGLGAVPAGFATPLPDKDTDEDGKGLSLNQKDFAAWILRQFKDEDKDGDNN